MKKCSMIHPSVKREALSHLKEDIKGYRKQRKKLGHEIKEDQKLRKDIRRGTSKKK